MPATPAPRIKTVLPAGGGDSLIGPVKDEPSA